MSDGAVGIGPKVVSRYLPRSLNVRVYASVINV
jgi:hypothetical protein